MRKYEYKVAAIPMPAARDAQQYEQALRALEAQLNALGAEGWELVQRSDHFFLLKRELMQAGPSCTEAYLGKRL